MWGPGLPLEKTGPRTGFGCSTIGRWLKKSRASKTGRGRSYVRRYNQKLYKYTVRAWLELFIYILSHGRCRCKRIRLQRQDAVSLVCNLDDCAFGTLGDPISTQDSGTSDFSPIRIRDSKSLTGKNVRCVISVVPKPCCPLQGVLL